MVFNLRIRDSHKPLRKPTYCWVLSKFNLNMKKKTSHKLCVRSAVVLNVNNTILMTYTVCPISLWIALLLLNIETRLNGKKREVFLDPRYLT